MLDKGIDRTKCLSAISQKKNKTDEEKQILKLNNIVWGCDICQEVCPYNEAALISPIKRFEDTRVKKIDKAFIDQMNMSESSKQYVAMIISIGHILHLKVISEGVESADQVEVLKNIGCDYIQGFVWGKPMPPEEAGKLVASIKK